VGQPAVILLDTHVAVWLAMEPGKISQKATGAIRKARECAEGLAICDISLLEIAALHRKGRLQLDTTLESFLSAIESRLVVVPITGAACVRSASFPEGYPSDPADRIIGATALVRGASLLTADVQIRSSKAVPVIW